MKRIILISSTDYDVIHQLNSQKLSNLMHAICHGKSEVGSGINVVSMLPYGYELKEIDADIYDKCLSNPITKDFVSSFENKECFLVM